MVLNKNISLYFSKVYIITMGLEYSRKKKKILTNTGIGLLVGGVATAVGIIVFVNIVEPKNGSTPDIIAKTTASAAIVSGATGIILVTLGSVAKIKKM
jgi:hypothetical protein